MSDPTRGAKPTLDAEKIERILTNHEYIMPDLSDPPRGYGYPGGCLCGCGASLGPAGPGIYAALAHHQAERLAASADTIITTPEGTQ